MFLEKEIDSNTFEVVINPNQIFVDKNQIINIIGYSTVPQHSDEMIDGILKVIPEKLNIRSGYKIVDVEKISDDKEGIILSKKFFRTDKIVTSQLKKIEKAAIFVSTIGSEMESWIKELNEKGNLALAYIADIMASEAAENAADFLHDHIKQKMSKLSLNVTNRYSPGYCNWSVSEQHKLFSLLPENFCGIKLTDSALMIPIKSISGIIGIGKNAKWKEYLCDKCGVKDCTYRIKMKFKKKLMA